MAFILGLSMPAFSQGDDDYVFDNRKKWRWKYQNPHEVSQQGQIQTIKIKLPNGAYYRFNDRRYDLKDAKSPRSGEVGRYTLLPVEKDSLHLVRPRKKGSDPAFEFRLAVISTVFIDDQKKYEKYVEIQVPASGNVITKEDIIKVEVENEFYDDSLLLYKLGDYAITLMDIGPKPYFEYSYFKSPAAEMDAAKRIVADFKEGAEFFRDKVKGAFTDKGPYAGKTASEILDAATEKDVIDCINFMVSNPLQYMGRRLKFTEFYADWILSGQPKGKFKTLKIEFEYAKWIQIRPISIDLIKGTIDDKPIQQVLINWKSLYPWYDGDEKDYPEHKYPQYYDYSLVGNSVTFFPKQKALKILGVSHQYYQLPAIKDGSPQELIKAFGQPTKVLGTLKEPNSYFYSRPYGTLEFRFDGFYGVATLIYLYPVKPAVVVQAEPD